MYDRVYKTRRLVPWHGQSLLNQHSDSLDSEERIIAESGKSPIQHAQALIYQLRIQQDRIRQARLDEQTRLEQIPSECNTMMSFEQCLSSSQPLSEQQRQAITLT